MKLLSFDFTNKTLRVFAQNGLKETFVEKNDCSGTELLLPLIDKCLKDVQLKISQVESLLVGVGPGSWTGSRISVATALGLIAGLPSVGLYKFTSFDMIRNFCDNEIVVVEAYSNFVFMQRYNEVGSCTTKDSVQKEIDSGKIVCGESKLLDKQVVVKINFPLFVKNYIKTAKKISSLELEPVYLKLSQAEEQLKQRLNKNDN